MKITDEEVKRKGEFTTEMNKEKSTKKKENK